MKCDDNQKWYMTSRWKNYKCNNEEYKWNDKFTWGNECDYNDDFKWGCKEKDNKNKLNDSNVENIEMMKGGIDELDIEEIQDVSHVEEIRYDEDDYDDESDNEDDGDNDYDDESEEQDDEDIINIKAIKEKKQFTTLEKQDKNIQLKDDAEERIVPMRHVLKQLMNMDVNDLEIGTERQGTLLNCRIIGIDNTLIKIQTDYNFALIPIGEIIGVYSTKIKDVILMELSEESYNKTEDEQELTEYIFNKVGKSIRINTSSNDELFRSVYGTVSKVGEGIVMLSKKMIIRINKIIYVEEDFQ